jgi:hypothetical protein
LVDEKRVVSRRSGSGLTLRMTSQDTDAPIPWYRYHNDIPTKFLTLTAADCIYDENRVIDRHLGLGLTPRMTPMCQCLGTVDVENCRLENVRKVQGCRYWMTKGGGVIVDRHSGSRLTLRMTSLDTNAPIPWYHCHDVVLKNCSDTYRRILYSAVESLCMGFMRMSCNPYKTSVQRVRTRFTDHNRTLTTPQLNEF